MTIQVKVNDETVISDSTIEDTDLEDAIIGIEARNWWIAFKRKHPSITKVEIEQT